MKRIISSIRYKWHLLKNLKCLTVLHTSDKNGNYDHSTIYLKNLFGKDFIAIDYHTENVWKRGSKPEHWQIADEVTNGNARGTRSN